MIADWTELPEEVYHDLMDHYSRIESHIFVELELAGIVIADSDFGDDDWSRLYVFESADDMDKFLWLTAFDGYMDGCWQTEVEPGFDYEYGVWIPRIDLHIVLRLLTAFNKVAISQYEAEWDDAVRRLWPPITG